MHCSAKLAVHSYRRNCIPFVLALIKLWWEPQSRGSLSVTLDPTPTIVLAKSLFGLKTESLVWVGAFVCCSTYHVDRF